MQFSIAKQLFHLDFSESDNQKTTTYIFSNRPPKTTKSMGLPRGLSFEVIARAASVFWEIPAQ